MQVSSKLFRTLVGVRRDDGFRFTGWRHARSKNRADAYPAKNISCKSFRKRCPSSVGLMIL
jgi:hypothetical protein